MPAAESESALAAQVDELVGSTKLGDTPGLAVLVARGGEILIEKGYGLADVESRSPITPDTKFRIGSVTKQFTAAAILKLQEQGRLRVEDTLATFLPGWPRGSEVTLAHLLTHTSGIADYTKTPAFTANVTTPVLLATLIDSFQHEPYAFAPGTQFRYNNSGYVLLGYVIEQASGQAYGDYLRTTFFDPIGMNDTGVYEAGRPVGAQALGYSYENGQVRRAVDWDMSRVPGAGALYSTVGDLYRWNEALFHGRVLSSASLEAAFTVGLVEGDDPRDPEETGYGFGTIVDTLRGQRELGHGGELAGFGSYLLWLPAHDLTVVVLLNCVPQMPGLQQWSLARGIAQLALGPELPPDQPPVVDTTVTTAELDSVTGRYDMGDGLTMTVTREGNRIFMEVTGRGRTEMFPRSRRTFFVGAGEADATFVTNANGLVIKAILKQAGARIDAAWMSGS